MLTTADKSTLAGKIAANNVFLNDFVNYFHIFLLFHFTGGAIISVWYPEWFYEQLIEVLNWPHWFIASVTSGFLFVNIWIARWEIYE